ncbi:glycosyl transferases group 1 family protein [Paraburkholderia xenovorans LB400]|uniref:Glycosyl transferase n=1 Tax=Paraburkholderia xenovorans (strain LB400) TaxID=266265 RepID=Q13FJ8_PARXL|nr:glycosyltransferase family 4 protein [Paraburkholderia xenovorans]ABE37141.1 putative glycosyl transferase [Paraburkholderia xenovorans LB400]AIP34681.1 glycosyl transferases group 1 family protein [Paraburkholderia xenovorans LB400]
MRIAQVAPLYESVPPSAYGATERVVSYLTEELVRRNHDVTLYASADSATRAKLVPVCERGLWRDAAVWDTLTHHVRQLALVARDADAFDIVHFHGDPLHFALADSLACRTLTTLHGRLLPVDHGPLFRQCPFAPLVSISNSQRKPVAWANWQRTVHHGLPIDEFDFEPAGDSYLLFLGRMMPEKRPDLAIEIARRAGMPLKVAAKVHPGEREYFRQQVEPLLQRSRDFVDYLGEIGGHVRKQVLAHARALLFPIEWDEPFGLTLIEAMACGTPVIAFHRGAIPEIVEHGVNGFMVDNVDEAVAAVARLDEIDRAACRRSFEARFSAARMTDDYLQAYEAVLATPPRTAASAAACDTAFGR